MRIPRRPAISDQELDRRLATGYRGASQATAAGEEQIQDELDFIAARAAVLADSHRGDAAQVQSGTASNVSSPKPVIVITRQHDEVELSVNRAMKFVTFMIAVAGNGIILLMGGASIPNVVLSLGMLTSAYITFRFIWARGVIQKMDVARKNRVAESEDRLTNT